MNLRLRTSTLVTAVTAALTAALVAVVTAAPATAARPPAVDLRGASVGSYALDAAGTALLSGAVSGKPFGGHYSATLASSDGSLPAPGTCEPATATMQVTGSQNRFLRLAATGEVCGTWADATYVVTHRFVGRYVVTDASSRRLRGTDGWISVILATEGRANVEAIDT
jgi:hypothetical protein